MRSVLRRFASSVRGDAEPLPQLQLLAHAQQLAGVGYFVWYPHDGRNEWSTMARKIYGFTDEEADTQDQALFFEIVHPDDRALVNERAWETFDTRTPTTIEHRIRRRSDGELRWVRSRCDIETDADGNTRLVGAVIDVTESRLAEEELRAKTGLLMEAQRIAGVGSFVWYPDGRTECSDESTRIFGLEPGHPFETAEGFFALIHPDDRAAVESGNLSAFEQGREYAVEFRIVRPDEEQRWLRELAHTECVDGRPVRLLGVILDITEAKLAEEELRTHAALLERAHEAARLGSYTVDLRARTIMVSRELAGVLGRGDAPFETSVEEFRRLVVHPDDLAGWNAIAEDAYSRPGPFTLARRAVRPDGEVIWLSIAGTVEVDESGVPVRAFGVMQDVSEQQLATETLGERAAMLERAHDAAQLAAFSVDPLARTGSISGEGARLLGLGEEPFEIDVDEFRRRFVHEDEVEAWTAEMDAAYERGGAFTYEHRLRRANRTVMWARIHGNVELDEHRRPIRAIGVLQDVTEAHRLEEQFRQAQKLEAVGQLAGGVAHDFNNLLTVIAGNAHLALASTGDEDVREDMHEILRSAERATELVRRLLAFSRSDLAEPRTVDLNQTIGGVRRMLSRLIEENIEVRAELTTGDANVFADPGQLEQVLLNLAVNARDAMPDGGRLTISTRADDETVTLRVTDTGYGMDEHTRARIFDPFFTTKPRGEGTGLGLSTVYGIVAKAGGDIAVDSEPGRGTTFTIHLPRAVTDRGENGRVEQRPLVPGSGERILIVEDEPMVRAIASEMLSRAGYEIETAENGEDALRLFDEGGTFDLLVSDLMMPKMTGTQLVTALRERGYTVPTVFTSGYPEGAAGKPVLDSTSVFISKPFTGEMLTGAVRRLLDRAAAV